MSSVTKRGPVKPTMNITPLIDVVFLLIIFFMLVNKIVTDEVPELQLPKVDDSMTSSTEGETRIIINVLPTQPFKKPGDKDKRLGPENSVKEVIEGRTGEAKHVAIGNKKWEISKPEEMEKFVEFTANMIRARKKNSDKKLKVLLRVDAAVQYGYVMPVMTSVQFAMEKGGLDPTKPDETALHMIAYMPKED